MTEDELKAAYAAFLLEAETPFAAALLLFPAEAQRGEACRIAFAWPNDPIVILEIERLKANGVRNKKIPTKEQVIEQLWELVQDHKTSAKDRGTNARIIAEMLNFIDKGSNDAESKRMPTAPVYKVVNE